MHLWGKSVLAGRIEIRWLVWVVFIFSLLLPLGTSAHNGGFPRLNGAASGQYRLYAWTLPNPWYAGEDLHISVAVTELDAKTDAGSGPSAEVLVADATVSATFEPSFGSSTVSFTRFLTATESLGGIYYESDLRLEDDGDWRVSILANGALGESVGEFVVTVMPNRQVNWLLIGSGGGLFVGLLVLAAILGRKRSLSTVKSNQIASRRVRAKNR